MDNEPIFGQINQNEQPLAVQVSERISQLIIQRHIAEGEKLLNEFELAELLHVGRGTIREAVKLLVARNVLEIRRGKGTYVAMHPGVVDDPFGFAYIQDEVKLAYDLLEARLLIEPWAAKMAAERATDDDLAKLTETYRLVQAKLQAKEIHLEEDAKFHVSIADCTHNLVLPKLIPVITYSVYQLGPLNFLASDYDNNMRQRTYVTHKRILDAICAHDPVEAESAMAEHLSDNRHSIEAYVKSLNNENT